jgi:hypothetical protein
LREYNTMVLNQIKMILLLYKRAGLFNKNIEYIIKSMFLLKGAIL